MVDTASEEETREWHRRCAIECNNAAWKLTEKTGVTLEEIDHLLNLAHGAAYHWSQVGTPLHTSRADMLLARAHAIAGNGDLALRYARRSHDFLSTHDCPDWEMAFSHAILAHAHHVSGHASEHERLHARAKVLGEAIADPEDRTVFLATFDIIPVP